MGALVRGHGSGVRSHICEALSGLCAERNTWRPQPIAVAQSTCADTAAQVFESSARTAPSAWLPQGGRDTGVTRTGWLGAAVGHGPGRLTCPGPGAGPPSPGKVSPPLPVRAVDEDWPHEIPITQGCVTNHSETVAYNNHRSLSFCSQTGGLCGLSGVILLSAQKTLSRGSLRRQAPGQPACWEADRTLVPGHRSLAQDAHYETRGIPASTSRTSWEIVFPSVSLWTGQMGSDGIFTSKCPPLASHPLRLTPLQAQISLSTLPPSEQEAKPLRHLLKESGLVVTSICSIPGAGGTAAGMQVAKGTKELLCIVLVRK